MGNALYVYIVYIVHNIICRRLSFCMHQCFVDANNLLIPKVLSAPIFLRILPALIFLYILPAPIFLCAQEFADANILGIFRLRMIVVVMIMYCVHHDYY